MPVKRQVIAVFANQDVGQQTRTGAATFDGARRQWGLGKGFTTGAGHAGAEDPAYHKAARDIFQFLGNVLTDLAQAPTAVSAVLTRRQHLILPIQMIWQGVAVVLAPGRFIRLIDISAVGASFVLLLVCCRLDLFVFL